MGESATQRRQGVPIVAIRSWPWWPEAGIIAAVAFAFHATLGGTAHLPYDAEFFHYPLLRAVQGLLAGGHLPVWDSSTYGGTPLLANAQAAWLYPPNLLLTGALTLDGQPLTEHALDVLVVAHIALAGVGTCAVAKRRGLGGNGALFAGVFVVLSGETVAQAQHLLMAETLAWLPFGVLVVDRLGERVTPRRVVALGIVFALMITPGFLPMVPACAALLIATAALRGPRRVGAVSGALAGMALGAIIAAAVLLPVLAVSGAETPPEIHGSLPEAALVTALFPNAFGHWSAPGAYLGVGGLTNSYYFIGAAAVVLLPIALTTGRGALVDGAVVLVLGLASFGGIGEKIAQLVQGVPTVGPLWRPEDVAYVAALPLGLLLARALSRPPGGRQLLAAAVTLVAVAVIPFSDSHGHVLHLLSNAPRRSLLALVLVGVLLVIARWTRQRREVAWLALACAAILGGAELASAVPGRYFVNSPGPATDAGPSQTGDGSAVLSFLRRHLAPGERVAANLAELPPQWAGFPPVWRLPNVNGFQPQLSKYQLARVAATGAPFTDGTRIFPIAPAVQPYLDEMDVRYIVTAAADSQFAQQRRYTMVFEDSIFRVYRVNGPLSHAYLIDGACVRRLGVDALLACRSGPAVTYTATAPATWRLNVPPVTGTRLLVTGEPWYPGWIAKSAGSSLPVRRVGYLAAVPVAARSHVVTLSYNPPDLVLGVVLSVLALSGSGAVLVAERRRRAGATPAV